MSDPALVLGINAYHGDASAALFCNGRCVAAAEEERFSRQKHQAGFPSRAVRWCLESTGASPGDLGHVALSRNPSAHMQQKLLFAARNLSGATGMLKTRLANAARILDARSAVAGALGVDPGGINARFHRVEHHRAHLASAYSCSPFGESVAPAACFSVDGMGDFVSTMWAVGAGGKISVKGYTAYPHSLGVYYTAFTQFLGMPHYGDEYKLMGLAAHGSPRFLPQLRQVLHLEAGLQFRLNLDYFLHDKEGVDMTWEAGAPVLGRLWSPKFEEVFGPARRPGEEISQRDMDLAASVQALLEEALMNQLRHLHSETGARRLVMAGGVALNCVANGMILSETPFDELWIQPAANDSGTAVGAGLWVWGQSLGNQAGWTMDHAYLGPEPSEVDSKRALEEAGLAYEWIPNSAVAEAVAGKIAEGAVVGWFQGRMEFGPRALGNRSILCDPRRADMKDILNSRIKNREFFRPFAPSVLSEKAGQWFQESGPSPYMLLAYKVRPDKRALIPAVVHEDGTSRVQTVDATTNPAFHALLAAFDAKTGVPMLLNTSFNENEPICRVPEEAVACFQRTRMDVLVLGNFVAQKYEKQQR